MSDSGLVAILVTDLVGSSTMFERFGEDATERHRRAYFALLRDALRAHGGREVKNTGDGLIAAFPTASAAVRAAIAMERGARAHGETNADLPITVKVGVHAGEPVHDAQDMFGKAILVTDALCAAAKGPRIIASALVGELCGTRVAERFSDAGEVAIEGLVRPVPAREVAWEEVEDDDEPALRDAGLHAILYTGLADPRSVFERLGGEASERQRQLLYRMLRDAVREHGGVETKTTADGMMVVFPTATAAVACAAAMQRRIHRWNDAHADEPIGLKLGLNAGEPVRDGADFFGRSVVLAARLCSRARAGQVLVTQAVRDLCEERGQGAFHDVGGLALKGLSVPIPAHEVAWTPDDSGRVPLPVNLVERHPPFVGRTEPLARLDRTWREARSGRTRVVLVEGEPGMGRTRLAGELARRLHAEGAVVLDGRAAPEAGVAFEPLGEALDQFVSASSEADLISCVGPLTGELAPFLPRLAARVPGLPPAMTGDADGQRHRVLEAAAALLTEVARLAPVLLVFDDVHLADAATQQFLVHLATTVKDAPIMVLGTLAAGDEGSLATLRALASEPRVERWTLPGFDEGEVDALIGVLRGRDVTAAFVRAVHVETGGNPFFTCELLRHLAETGALAEHDGRWTPDLRLGATGLPKSVQDVIGARLARLSASSRSILRAAAVVGREISVQDLEPVVDATLPAIVEALETATALGVLVEVPRAVGRHAFASPLVRDSLHAELSLDDLARIHLRAAEAIELAYGSDLEARLSEVASHLAQAVPFADVSKAIDITTRAGERATRLLAYEEAVRLHELALVTHDRVPSADREARLGLLLTLASALRRAGDVPAARHRFAEAAEAARVLGSAEATATAALGFAGRSRTFQLGVHDETAVALLEEAHAGSRALPAPLRVRVLARLGAALAFSDDPSRAPVLAREGVELARELGDPGLLADALRQLRLTLASPGDLGERLETSSAIVRAAQQAGDVEAEFDGRQWLIVDLLEQGNVADADDELDACARLAEALRQPVRLAVVRMVRGLRLLMHGRFAEVELLASQGAGAQQHAELEAMAQAFRAQMFLVRREQGRLAELEPAIKVSLERYPRLVAWKPALAWIYAETGRLDDARREMERLAARDFLDLPRGLYWNVSVAMLAETCAVLRDARRAAILLDAFASQAPPCIMSVGTACWGSSARVLGLLAATAGHPDAAARHFEQAIAVNSRMGERPWLAHARHAYARLLAGWGRPGDRERAEQLARSARETAALLGMTALESRAGALLSEIAGGPRKDS